MVPDNETEEIEIRLLLEGIRVRYGYDLRDYASESMRRRLRVALSKSGLPHLGEFQHRLLTDRAFFTRVLDDLTVRVSDMFRDPTFYLAFRRHVVPLLRTYPRIKIWHAGCASGEEVYGTAILLAEENLYDRTQIYATDVSEAALDRARQGVYSQAQATRFGNNYAASGGTGRFEQYYSAAYGHVAFNETLRKNMVFFQHDLVTDYALGEMHVIFCRNVLIYFGDKLQDRVLAMFSGSLCRGGFLCLGATERLPPRHASSFTEFEAEGRIYRRRDQAVNAPLKASGS